MRSALLSILLVCVLGVTARGQVIDATQLGDSVDLSGNWRFQWGDDARWTQPDFDDSGWRVISTKKSWSEQGVERRPGFFWYRARVKLPARHGPLSLLSAGSPVSYEIYANGRLIGRLGSFPPQPKTYRGIDRTFSIPDSATRGESMVLAIRFWMWPLLVSGAGDIYGGIVGPRGLVLGTPRAIESEHDNWRSGVFYLWLPRYTVGILSLMLGLVLLVLYRFQRENTEYLWLALLAFAMTANAIKQYFVWLTPTTSQAGTYWSAIIASAGEILLIEFVFRFLRRPMPKWMRAYQISVIFQFLIIAVFYAGWITAGATEAVLFLWNLPYELLLPALVVWHFWQGNKEAGLLVIPLLLSNLDDILSLMQWSLYHLGLRHSTAAFLPPIHMGPVIVDTGDIANLLFILSIGALLLYRFHQTSQEQAHAKAELEAARSMQEVMVPTQTHSVPGFQIETAYLPAQEVGGDFFQLYPAKDDSLLVVIGDVSGKGMKAAMLVSMILGLLRSIVQETREPACVLHRLNDLLAGQMDGRFATGCCALISRDGTVRMANAGHLSPYSEGCEIDVPGGLPLGLAEDVAYQEIEFDLRPGARLVFLSDGVVEARDGKSGELYGFDRTRTVSVQPADQIAADAQRFGQQDDITVIGISAVPVTVTA
jgi:sigma-B regulation protein RsbU (phosphoserine phosphatase)